MYNVPIPSVENDQVLLYLKNTGQINVWETVRKGKVTSTRPTYKELIEEVKIGDEWRRKWDTDKVYEWHEQLYNEFGKAIGNPVKKYFSVQAYARMLHEINEKDNILQQINRIKNVDGLEGFNDTYEEDGEDYVKPYLQKHIETPNLFFRNMCQLTFKMYEDLTDPYNDEITPSTNQANRKVISLVHRVLDDMLQKYPTLIIHLDIERSLKISLSYQKVERNGKVVHEWDTWYIRHLLHYAPYLFQRPYYSKERGITEDNNVFLYHMLTYQTANRDGDFWALTNKEINELCGKTLKDVKDLTPHGQRIPFNRLSTAKRLLVRQAFGDRNESIDEHVQFVGVIIGRWIDKNLTNDQIKRQSLKEYEDEFKKDFKYTLTKKYILSCIEKRMSTVDWWDESDTQRLRKGRVQVGERIRVKKEKTTEQELKKREDNTEKTKSSEEEREDFTSKIVDEAAYYTGSDSGQSEYDSSDDEFNRGKKVRNEYDYYTGSDEEKEESKRKIVDEVNYDTGSDGGISESEDSDDEATRRKIIRNENAYDTGSDSSSPETASFTYGNTTITGPLVDLSKDSDEDEVQQKKKVAKPVRQGKKKKKVTVKKEMTPEEYKRWKRKNRRRREQSVMQV